ncbi:hypothetical protein PR048_020636 [Dryococelus australis]|uniref:Uncharacterized protein n=1 Tax=Dryococelus australis TaxID=614101 RepID=A0ABQ9H6U2_9NEOP|nr:hypothetical protein PR048_020636 [Dryococelus australis]
MEGRGKREIPDETRPPTALSGTIPTREYPGAAPPGIEPGSPCAPSQQRRDPRRLPPARAHAASLCLHRVTKKFSTPACLQTAAFGVTVTERLDCSPPTQAIRIQSLAGTLPDFRIWESCRTMPLLGGFSRGSPVPPPHFYILPSITLIGSQDVEVKSRPNFSITRFNDKLKWQFSLQLQGLCPVHIEHYTTPPPTAALVQTTPSISSPDHVFGQIKE